MKLFKITLSFLFLLVFFSACRKDDLVVDEQPIPPAPVVKFEINTTGEVYDLQGEAIDNAIITFGDATTVTDQNGYFNITGLVNSDKAVVSVEKTGYFSGHPVFYPKEGTAQHVEVTLMNRIARGTVSSLNKVVSFNQHQVDFTNASFKDASGNPYSGDVTVFATYLDPTDEDLQRYMPGDLTAIDANNEAQLLESFGMLNVELEDNMGNTLNIDGEAELTMEIPSEILGSAPSTIPLWYFDEALGTWKEDGEATLVGTQYVGTVTHFTLWNCDIPRDYVFIDGTVNGNLRPASFLVRITRPNGDFRTTSLNENMQFSGAVPAGEILTLEVLDQCGNVLLTQTIGPLSSDTSVGTLDVTAAPMTTITISGNAIDCDLAPVTNGYAIVSDGYDNNYFLELDNNGNFSGILSWCQGNAVNVIAFDSDETRRSETATFDFNNTIEANNIVTCEDNVAGIFISGPVVNKFIPATSNFEGSNLGQPTQVFTMSCVDSQGNGNSVIYNTTILSWTNDPTNPQLASTYETTIIGSPEVYTWTTTSLIPILEFYDPTSGGLIDVEHGNVTITITDAQQNIINHPGHNLRIVGPVD